MVDHCRPTPHEHAVTRGYSIIMHIPVTECTTVHGIHEPRPPTSTIPLAGRSSLVIMISDMLLIMCISYITGGEGLCAVQAAHARVPRECVHVSFLLSSGNILFGILQIQKPNKIEELNFCKFH